MGHSPGAGPKNSRKDSSRNSFLSYFFKEFKLGTGGSSCWELSCLLESNLVESGLVQGTDGHEVTTCPEFTERVSGWAEIHCGLVIDENLSVQSKMHEDLRLQKVWHF